MTTRSLLVVLSACVLLSASLVSGCSVFQSGDTEGPMSEEGVTLYPTPGETGIGYIDASGEQVIGETFADGLPLLNGFGPVMPQDSEGLWGYTDSTGRMVIEAQYEEAYNFEGGRARAQSEGLWGFIDETGEFAIEPMYVAAGPFSEGLAPVQLEDGGLIGFIDESGETVIEPQFESAGAFGQGMAPVVTADGSGYIDETGELVLGPYEYQVFEFTEDGLALFSDGVLFGYLDTSGEIAIEPAFMMASSFYEGVAPAQDEGGLFGFIGKDGEWVLEPQFDEAGTIIDGIAPVITDGQQAYINIDGEVIWPRSE